PMRLDRALESSELVVNSGVLNQVPTAHDNPDPAHPIADPLGAPSGTNGQHGNPLFTEATAGSGSNGRLLTYAETKAPLPVHTAGENAAATDAVFAGDASLKTGINQLLKTDIFNILVFPPLGVTELV